jgi:hypothetical protein
MIRLNCEQDFLLSRQSVSVTAGWGTAFAGQRPRDQPAADARYGLDVTERADGSTLLEFEARGPRIIQSMRLSLTFDARPQPVAVPTRQNNLVRFVAEIAPAQGHPFACHGGALPQSIRAIY